ncbi:MAG: glutamine amidotransferase, partial [Planctomycetota bacterium]
MDSISFSPILGPTSLVIVFGCALAMLLIGPSFRNLTSRRRMVLTLTRLGVILMAFAALLRPGCVQKIEKSQAAVLLFLLDASRSMELAHVSDDSTRWGTAVDMINQNIDKFEQLKKNNIDVRFFTFDNRLSPVEYDEGSIELPKKPEGGETDIGTAVFSTAIDLRDQRLLATILASDGVQNASDPEIELNQAVDSLVDIEVPLIAVQLGLPGETAAIADVAVTSFPEQQVVNKKNDLIARATVVARGYANQDIPLELVLIDSGGREEVVATKLFRPDNSYQESNVELKFSPAEAGEYRLKVRASAMPGELAVRNNELEGFLTVRDKGMSVLFLSGSLGWEQRFLRDTLSVIDFVDLDFEPIYTNAGSRRTWPLADYGADFRDPDKYDVFVLSNVDASALYDFRTKQGPLVDLAEAVSGGKGLLMLGGSHSFGAGGYGQTPLADVLPVQMRATERQSYDQDVRKDLHINEPFTVRPSRDHFVTRIGEIGSNRGAWARLPSMAGANRIVAKQTAEVLLESDDEVARPIMVVGNIGGRVMAFAGDLSWQWKRGGFVAEHDQFWRQIILWLAFWDGKGDESVSIELPKRRFSPKSILNFDVNVRTISGEAVENVSFDASLVFPNRLK